MGKKIKRQKKKKRIWKVVLLLAVLAAAAGAAVFWSLDIRQVTVNGNQYYTAEEIEDRLFPGTLEKRTVYVWLEELLGKKKEIPFIQNYTVEITGLHSVSVIVYEKSYAGCIYDTGNYLYFDRDGIVVDSYGELIEGVPVVEGLPIDHAVLYQPLPVENKSIFSGILNLTQQLQKYGIQADKVRYNSKEEITVYIGDIRAKLGKAEYLEEKVAELYSMLGQLEGEKGTLHLETYEKDGNNEYFSFIPDNS